MVRAIRAGAIVVVIVMVFLVVVQTADADRCFQYSEEIGTVCDGRVESDPGQFEAPDAVEESLLNYTTYAYMEE